MKSLRLKLFIGTSLLLLMFSFLMGYALNNALNSYTVEAEKNQLESIVYRLLAAVEVDAKGVLLVDEANLQIDGLNLPDSSLFANIISSDSQLIWGAKNINSLNTRPPAPGDWVFNNNESNIELSFGFEWLNDENNYYHYGLNVLKSSGQLQQQQQLFFNKLFLWLLSFSIVMLFAFILFLGWALQPLKRIRSELGYIQQGKRKKLSDNFPAEIQPLSTKINQLIKHEKLQKKRYRNAVDDMAHSLKTPLAVLSGLEIIQSDPTVKEQLGRMDSIINHQLSRAATAGKQQNLTPVYLFPVVERMIDSLMKVYKDRGINFNNQIDPETVILIDESDLFEILGNVMDNAAKHCSKRVLINANNDESGLTISIDDDGKGIEPSQREAILSRGIRADETYSGQGIGLAMTLDIIKAYDGDLLLSESDSAGLQVTISIPG